MPAIAIPSAWSRSRTPNWLPTSAYNAGSGVYFPDVTSCANDASVAIAQNNDNDQFRVILNPLPLTAGTHTITSFHAAAKGLTADSCKAATFALWKLVGSTYTPATTFRAASQRAADADSFVEMSVTGLTDSFTVAAGETWYIGLAVHLAASYTGSTIRLKDGATSPSQSRHWTFTVVDENHDLSDGLTDGTTGVDWLLYATFTTANRVITDIVSPVMGTVYPACWYDTTNTMPVETISIEQVVCSATRYCQVQGWGRVSTNGNIYNDWIVRLGFVTAGAYYIRMASSTGEVTEKVLADEEAGCQFHVLVHRLLGTSVRRHDAFYCNQSKGQGGAYPGVTVANCPDVDSNVTWLSTATGRSVHTWTGATSTHIRQYAISTTVTGTPTIGKIRVGIEPAIWLGDSQFANTPSAGTPHAFARVGAQLVADDPLRIHINASIGGGMWTEKAQTVSSPIWYRYLHPTIGAGELAMLAGPALLVLGSFSNDINSAGGTAYETYNRSFSLGGWLQGVGKIINACSAGSTYSATGRNHKIWAIGAPPENSYTAMEASQMVAMNEILHQVAFCLDGKSSDLFYASVDTTTTMNASPQFRAGVSSDGTHADGDLAAISAQLLAERDYTTVYKMHVTDYWTVENSLPGASSVYVGVDRGDETVGTLRASNIGVLTSTDNLTAADLRYGKTVDDVVGDLRLPNAGPEDAGHWGTGDAALVAASAFFGSANGIAGTAVLTEDEVASAVASLGTNITTLLSRVPETAASQSSVNAIPTNPLLADDSRLPATALAAQTDIPIDYQQRGVAVTLPATGVELAASQSLYAPARAGDILATPANKLATDASGAVTPTAASKTGYALAATGLDAISVTDPTGDPASYSFRQWLLWGIRRLAHPVKTSTAITVLGKTGTTLTTQTATTSGTTQTTGEPTAP